MSHLQLYRHTDRGQGWRPSTGTANLSNFYCMTGWEKVHIHGGLWGEESFTQKGSASVSTYLWGQDRCGNSLTLSSSEMTKCVKLKAAKRRFQTRYFYESLFQKYDCSTKTQQISSENWQSDMERLTLNRQKRIRGRDVILKKKRQFQLVSSECFKLLWK